MFSQARAPLEAQAPNYMSDDLEICNRECVLALQRESPFDLIVHTTAQPSHDLAAQLPFADFGMKARGTVDKLEATRLTNPAGQMRNPYP